MRRERQVTTRSPWTRLTPLTTLVAAVVVGALGALGALGGCDGPPMRTPTPPHLVAARDGGVEPARADAEPDAGVARPRGAASFLDAPAGSLDPLFGGLAAAEHRDPSGRALLLFFGDSHTAGDAMTARLRQTLQARFGDAGRGLVGAGRVPYRHYYQRDVRYGAAGSWKAVVGGHRQPEPFGILGMRVSGASRGSQLWVETCADCPSGTRVGQFDVLYYAAPDHGLLRYRVDDAPWQVAPTRTAPGEAPHPAHLVVPAGTDAAHKLTLEHGGKGPLDLFGIALERPTPGVIVDALGVVGRRLGSLKAWDWSVIGAQLALRDPRLVVLQYGTNEADDPDLDLEQLAGQYDEVIARIRATAPGAAILILGPPDLGVREAGRACDRMAKRPAKPGAPGPDGHGGHGRDGGHRAPPRPAPHGARLAVADAGVADDHDRADDVDTGLGDAGVGEATPDGGVATDAGAPDPEADVIPECRWRTPGVLGEIIAVQHAAAARNHVAFFDTFAAMGGADHMHGWVLADPRVAYKDHVHFTEVGYGRWADALSTELLAAYAAWRPTPSPSPSTPGPGVPPPPGAAK
jgi:lysophospholipase L1-like esterase